MFISFGTTESTIFEQPRKAFRSDFLHNPREPQRVDGLSQQSGCSFKFVPQKIAYGKSTAPRGGACSVSYPGLLAKLTLTP